MPLVRRGTRLPDGLFKLGVASGDPAPDSMVLWTRLAPRPLEGGGMPEEPVDVQWEMADDEAFRRVRLSGTAVANPESAHAVHVEPRGLSSDRWYFYRFHAGGQTSPIGATRTMPRPDARPARLRFAFASCQHWEAGLFTAYEHMAAEQLDLVVHLGDYIYEGAARPSPVRSHIGPELHSLYDYRNRYAQYRTDPALQGMHARAPWILTWDDHEFDNNYAGGISEELDVDPAAFLRRRSRAYQAYWEHMPLRRQNRPHGPAMRLYRRLPFGRLAEFFVLDTRQYRTDQPEGDGNKPPSPALLNPKGTLLGRRQREWLEAGLSGSAGTWNVLAQQVMLARADRAPGAPVRVSMDQWPGYEFERRRLLGYLRDSAVRNPVVLTGDIHTNWANELVTDFDPRSPGAVGVEFVGTSITSGGDGTAAPATLPALLSENPFVKFHNAERGYVRCEVTPDAWRADYRTVPYVTRRGAPCVTRASFVVESDRPALHRA